jgi:uncharacterized repeat protein (TIGR04076 family)
MVYPPGDYISEKDLPMPNKIRLEIIEIQGKGICHYGHKVGDKFKWPDDTGKLCPHAFYVLYPGVDVLRFGGVFPWEDDPDKTSLCCPDPNNPVVFDIRRVND